MSGTLRPKSLSTDEAAAYIAAGPSIQRPNAGITADPEPADPGEVALEQLRVTLAEAVADIDDTPDETLDAAPEPAANPELEASEHEGLRSTEEIDVDVEMICGPGALATAPEERHLASMRLLEDLVAARLLLDNFWHAFERMQVTR